jgi:hypothetical protein
MEKCKNTLCEQFNDFVLLTLMLRSFALDTSKPPTGICAKVEFQNLASFTFTAFSFMLFITYRPIKFNN